VSADVLNPVDIENRIQECARRIHKGVGVVTAAESEFRTADRLFDVAFAHAYLDHRGPAHEKKYAATIATEKERETRDVAEVAFKHADRTAKAIESELRALQSVGASVRAMYGAEKGFGS
jgi:hypothetical protein